jgi:hypothetical protein
LVTEKSTSRSTIHICQTFLQSLSKGKQVVTPNLDELELGFGEEPPLVHLHLGTALVLEPEERGDREVKGLEALKTKHKASVVYDRPHMYIQVNEDELTLPPVSLASHRSCTYLSNSSKSLRRIGWYVGHMLGPNTASLTSHARHSSLN